MKKVLSCLIIIILFVLGVVLYDFSMFIKPRLINKTNSHEADFSLAGSLYHARKNTGVDFAITLLSSLRENETIESRAVSEYESQGIGERTGGRGLLFLVSEAEQALKIEVGRDLEGIFTDILCANIERAAHNYLVSGNYRDFLTEIIVTMGIHYKESREQEGHNPDNFPLPSPGRVSSAGGGIKSQNVGLKIADINSEYFYQGNLNSEDYQAAKDPARVVRAYLDSLKLGHGRSDLPLLTGASKYLRDRLPRTKSYQKRIYKFYQSAGDYLIVGSNTHKMAAFNSGAPVYPILLRASEDGLWYVDEVHMLSHVHAFENGGFYFKYLNNPYKEAQRSLPKGHSLRTVIYYHAPEKFPVESVLKNIHLRQQELNELIGDNQADPNTFFAAGDFYLFERFELKAAQDFYERGLKIDPKSNYRWRLFDVVINGHDILYGIDQLKLLVSNPEVGEYYRTWLELLESSYLPSFTYYQNQFYDYLTFRLN